MISSVGVSSVTQTYETSATDLSAILTARASSGSSATSCAGGDTATISDPAQLFNDLKALQEQDPTKFKEVTADIAEKLKDAASSADGDQSKFLTFLASRFEAASQSGDVTDLLPPQQGAAGATSATSTTSITGTYDSRGQLPPPPPPLADGSNTDLSKLFESIRTEVSDALASVST